MLVLIFGESCTGKSHLADRLRAKTGAELYTGKDYLRLAKSEALARAAFQKKLSEAVAGDNLIYVAAEMSHLALMPEGAVRVLVTADLDLILQRFAARMGGVLPPPVKTMLEKKHGGFDELAWDYHIHNSDQVDAVCSALAQRMEESAHDA